MIRSDRVYLAGTEIAELNAWFLEHKETCKHSHYEIEQGSKSGIGTNSWVRCLCGARKDITDYSLW